MTTHKQSVYIVQDQDSKLHIFQYAPTMTFDGRKDSDQYALMQGLFIDQPSHDLWLGEVICHKNIPSHSGIQTIKGLKATIVAKQSFDWDMNQPLGQRKSNVKETKNFNELIGRIRASK